MKSLRFRTFSGGALLLWLSVSGSAGGIACGLPQGSQTADDGSPRWEGAVLLGTQCPYGMISSARQPTFRLRNCPIQIPALRLSQPPSTVLFAGDCREKTLAIRTADLTLDTTWQVTPDNRFSLTVGPIWIQLAEDADGHSRCWSGAELYVRGQLECSDQDRMQIRFEEITLLLAPLAPAGPAPDGEACHLPASCELTASDILKQCI